MNCPAATERADRPVWASRQCDSRGMNRLTTSFASAAAHTELVQVGPQRGPIRQRAAAPTGSTTYMHGADGKSFPVTRSVPPQWPRSDPARPGHGTSLPDSCIAEINRKVTNRSTTGCRGSTLAVGVRVRATMRWCDVPPCGACPRTCGRRSATEGRGLRPGPCSPYQPHPSRRPRSANLGGSAWLA